MMRALVIDDAAKAAAQRVIAHAERHHYEPGRSKWVPGDDDRFVARLGTFRCVFTFTRSRGRLYRHLSISIPGSKYPNPAAAFMLADLFGFTGWDENEPGCPGDGWGMAINQPDQCVVLVQPVDVVAVGRA